MGMVLSSSPELEITGYENLNEIFAEAAFALLSKLGVLDRLRAGEAVSFEQYHESRYLQACLDFLIGQGYLVQEGSAYRVNGTSPELIEGVEATYAAISAALKRDIGLGSADSVLPEEESARLVALPAALTYCLNTEYKNGLAYTVFLEVGESIPLADLNGPAARYFQVLEAMEIVKLQSSGSYILTDRGVRVLPLSGYSTLILSYYRMLANLEGLLKGNLSYGLGNDVDRDAELNALGSNGMITVKVAPFLTQALRGGIDERLRRGMEGDWNAVKDASAFMDFGSGGADMLMQVAENGPDSIECLVGIDVNPETITAAEGIIKERGLSDRIDLLRGTIVDKSLLAQAKTRLDSVSEEIVSTINFILHDIGPELSKQFLRAYAEVFGDMPLIITETMRVPIQDIQAYPYRQPASFQFMHTASGQHLYSEGELRDLLAECGFEIRATKTHSSVPTADGGRCNTIVSWVVVKR